MKQLSLIAHLIILSIAGHDVCYVLYILHVYTQLYIINQQASHVCV